MQQYNLERFHITQLEIGKTAKELKYSPGKYRYRDAMSRTDRVCQQVLDLKDCEHPNPLTQYSQFLSIYLYESKEREKKPAQRLAISKLHTRESSISSGLEDDGLDETDWLENEEQEEFELD